jgi:glycerol-3-phosphate acyltransferase PlsX
MLPIAVDAMGGDRAPGEIVEGAKLAVAAGIPIVLVGPPDLASRVDIGDIPVIPASEVIAMDEDPAGGVRRKKDSTLVRAAEAVRDGAASAMISAGNTGATMASALLRMGRIKGVSRPGIATPIPVIGSTPTILLDAGANAEVQPEWLVQFGQMGAVYARHRFGLAEPKVGLLSIGEEAGKGDSLRKETFKLLEAAPHLRFIGNVEGRDILTDDVDVVVTDGFTGNVVLKSLEGCVKSVKQAFVDAIASVGDGAHTAALAPVIDPLLETLDPDTYGGAVLLGVEGVCVISHGSTGPTAMLNGIRMAEELVTGGLVDELRRAVQSVPPGPQ